MGRASATRMDGGNGIGGYVLRGLRWWIGALVMAWWVGCIPDVVPTAQSTASSGDGGSSSSAMGGDGGGVPCVPSGGCSGDPRWPHWVVANAGLVLDEPVTGVIRDGVTKLSWETTPDDTPMNWSDAKAYCEALVLDGGCWRLPTRVELVTLLDPTVTNPMVKSVAAMAQYTDLGRYWTDTVAASDDTKAWTVGFGTGQVFFYPQVEMQRVRCVRWEDS